MPCYVLCIRNRPLYFSLIFCISHNEIKVPRSIVTCFVVKCNSNIIICELAKENACMDLGFVMFAESRLRPRV